MLLKLNDDIQIISEILDDVALVRILVTVSHTNESSVILLKRPCQKPLLTLFHPSLKVIDWHTYGSINVACSLGQLRLGHHL